MSTDNGSAHRPSVFHVATMRFGQPDGPVRVIDRVDGTAAARSAAGRGCTRVPRRHRHAGITPRRSGSTS